jgi:hypothetical protein
VDGKRYAMNDSFVFNRYISTATFQPLHFNRYISTATFQPLHFNCYISTATFQPLHFNRYISTATFQLLHFNKTLSHYRIPSSLFRTVTWLAFQMYLVCISSGTDTDTLRHLLVLHNPRESPIAQPNAVQFSLNTGCST